MKSRPTKSFKGMITYKPKSILIRYKSVTKIKTVNIYYLINKTNALKDPRGSVPLQGRPYILTLQL